MTTPMTAQLRRSGRKRTAPAVLLLENHHTPSPQRGTRTGTGETRFKTPRLDLSEQDTAEDSDAEDSTDSDEDELPAANTSDRNTRGPPGKTGMRGPQGVRGHAGPPGTRGSTGARGRDGVGQPGRLTHQ